MGFFSNLFGQFKSSKNAQLPTDCPQCQTRLEQGCDVFKCPRCQGFWVPEVLFSILLKETDQQIEELLQSPPPGSQTYSPSPSPRKCACCAQAMDNYPFGYESGIWIDACPKGHGIWLDAGELPLLRAASGATPSGTLFKNVMQAVEKG